jgi:hypothetical protein
MTVFLPPPPPTFRYSFPFKTQRSTVSHLSASLFVILMTLSQLVHDSSVGIALGYGMDDNCSRVRFPAGTGNVSLHYRFQNGSGAHPASYPMGTGAVSLGVKRPGRAADHSPPSSAEVKQCVSTPCRGAQLSTGTTLSLP